MWKKGIKRGAKWRKSELKGGKRRDEKENLKGEKGGEGN